MLGHSFFGQLTECLQLKVLQVTPYMIFIYSLVACSHMSLNALQEAKNICLFYLTWKMQSSSFQAWWH